MQNCVQEVIIHMGIRKPNIGIIFYNIKQTIRTIIYRETTITKNVLYKNKKNVNKCYRKVTNKK